MSTTEIATPYDREMHSPDGTEAVKAAAVAWRDAVVHLPLSNVIAPPRMQDDATFVRSMDALVDWIRAALGALQPIQFGLMRRPGPVVGKEDLLLPILSEGIVDDGTPHSGLLVE